MGMICMVVGGLLFDQEWTQWGLKEGQEAGDSVWELLRIREEVNLKKYCELQIHLFEFV